MGLSYVSDVFESFIFNLTWFCGENVLKETLKVSLLLRKIIHTFLCSWLYGEIELLAFFSFNIVIDPVPQSNTSSLLSVFCTLHSTCPTAATTFEIVIRQIINNLLSFYWHFGFHHCHHESLCLFIDHILPFCRLRVE